MDKHIASQHQKYITDTKDIAKWLSIKDKEIWEEDYTTIWDLYKKYLDPNNNIKSYRTDCECGNSIFLLYDHVKSRIVI